MAESKIEWTDSVWNPVVGCRRVSSGCERCYAERMAHRLECMGKERYRGLTVLGKAGRRWSGEFRTVPEVLDKPLRWRKPRMVFVNSMSDLFGEGVPFEFIAAVFGVMAACPQHTFQVLTKRPARMVEFFRWMDSQPAGRGATAPPARLHACWEALRHELLHHPKGDGGPLHTKRCADPDGPWPLPNVWLGVSCENQATADERIPLLLQCPAAVRWVSAEPLLSAIELPEHHQSMGAVRSPIDWVVAGGESGPGARPCNVEWIRSIVSQCSEAQVACFVKQGGKSNACEHSNKGCVDCLPDDVRVREFPDGT